MGRVTLDHVTKKFDGTTAVDDLSLAVADEEFLVLLGPSGCGKSTALRMIAGLETPTAGTITIGDRVVNDVEAKDRDIAMVFQSYALYPHMTVRRNIEFPLRSRHVAAADRDQLVADAAESLGLDGLLDRKPGAALGRPTPAGRARARDRPAAPGVPHGRAALEPRREAARADPRRARRAAAATVRHHRVRHPRSGRGDDDGPPHRGARRREAPADRPAARRLRAAREPLRGALHREPTDEHRRRGASRVWPSRSWWSSPVGARRSLRNSRRQSKPRASTKWCSARAPKTSASGQEGGVTAVVAVVESLGHECHVACRLDDGQLVIVRQRASADVPAPGDPVRLIARPEVLHVFDPTSGDRLDSA